MRYVEEIDTGEKDEIERSAVTHSKGTGQFRKRTVRLGVLSVPFVAVSAQKLFRISYNCGCRHVISNLRARRMDGDSHTLQPRWGRWSREVSKARGAREKPADTPHKSAQGCESDDEERWLVHSRTRLLDVDIDG